MTTLMDTSSVSHRQTWDLIPWIVNGSATMAEREQVEDHLRTCADCRDEYAFQSQLHAGMTVDSAAQHDPIPAFQRLLARIDDDHGEDHIVLAAATQAATRPARRRQPAQARRSSRWTQYRTRVLTAAVIVQSVGLIVLGTLLLRDRTPDLGAPYQTLSRPGAPVATATIRFVPMPTLSVGAMQAILADANVRIVESNQGSSIYGLAPDSGPKADGTIDTPAQREAKTAAALTRLRAQQGVLLAEPIATPASALR